MWALGSQERLTAMTARVTVPDQEVRAWLRVQDELATERQRMLESEWCDLDHATMKRGRFVRWLIATRRLSDELPCSR